MKKILTIVLDGFGISDNPNGNAPKIAQMNNYNSFYEKYPHTSLWASEEYVGLEKGQMGGSEVGHQTIGAGRVLDSSQSVINKLFSLDIESESYNKLLQDNTKTVHLMGLCSDGNIHSDINHFIKMYDALVSKGFTKIYFHLITDGRDTKTDVSINYISQIASVIAQKHVGSIATICGRFYAMDRDANFDRTKKYYDLVTRGIGARVLNIPSYLKTSYENNITDEFLHPVILDDNGLIKENDILVWLNFRADRAKQILKAFKDPKFTEFSLKDYSNLELYTFFDVDKSIKANILCDNHDIEGTLGMYFSSLGLRQARVAESEKYPHITYFFDGKFEGKIPFCDKFHIPSPQVATYDQKPEMSAVAVTKQIIKCMEDDYDFIFANYANPDMVGHTGNLEATVKALEAIDVCLGKIFEVAEDNFYTIVLLADHGNCDKMINEDGSVCTTHTLSKVPFIISDTKVKFYDDGSLANVAPTILDYMDITIPKQMTSDSLLCKK